MNFKTKQTWNKKAEISMIPLIDLFMNILVFFMVTTSFGLDTVFFVDLPTSEAGQSVGQLKSLSISIHENGDVAVNNSFVFSDQLQDYLFKLIQGKGSDLPVLIRADAKASHGDVVAVLDVVKALGLTNVGITTRKGN
ncbi:MAG: biopolymer transporter ExbD [Bdellovibrionota bacterium]